MKLTINNYPYDKDFVFCIGLDDLHPEDENDLEHLDFGSSSAKNPLKLIGKTLKEHKKIKITLFATPNWIDRSDLPSSIFFPLRKFWRKRRAYAEETFDISDKRYRGWVREINSFYPENIEIAHHGLSHHNVNQKHFRSEEFAGLSKNEQSKRLVAAENKFAKSQLRHTKGFRPPGWYMSKDLLDIVRQRNYLYIAANSDMKSPVLMSAIAQGAGLKNQLLIKETNNNGIYNFTANCYPEQLDRAMEIIKNKGILLLHCHLANTEFGLPAVTSAFPMQISNILQEARYRTGLMPWFATIDELAKFIIARDKLSYKITGTKVLFTNNSRYSLKGLTFLVDGKIYMVDIIQPFKEKIVDLSADDQTKVTIVLTVYNGEELVGKSLESLANQSYANTEIIVVNDGSSDSTRAVVKKFISERNDKRISLIDQENRGRAGAKNTGLKKSSGIYVAFCEDDAIYSKDYIKNAIPHLKDNNILGVIGPHFVWNREESLITRAKDLERRRNFHIYKPTSAWIYRRSDLLEVGGFNESLEFGEDTEPAVKLQKKYPGKSFAFEKDSIWLHREPKGFYQYLKRKWRGGVGMALLDKEKIRVFPPKLKVALVLLPFILIACVSLTIFLLRNFQFPVWFFLVVLIALFSILLVLRKKDIKKSKNVSTESMVIICICILIEYIWWCATLIGIYTGYLLSASAIKKLLKGR